MILTKHSKCASLFNKAPLESSPLWSAAWEGGADYGASWLSTLDSGVIPASGQGFIITAPAPPGDLEGGPRGEESVTEQKTI